MRSRQLSENRGSSTPHPNQYKYKRACITNRRPQSALCNAICRVFRAHTEQLGGGDTGPSTS